MPIYIALLRGINVGGTGLLPMKDLVKLCQGIGFADVRTYIQSGNVVFQSALAESKACTTLETALEKKMGKPISVMVRSASEMNAVLDANPFPERDAAKTAVIFFPSPPEKTWLQQVTAPGGEELHLGKREVYIYYPDGMGKSKLKLPAAVTKGTARNINTVSKLASMAAAI